MPFSYRVFCTDPTSPSLSESLVWLGQHGFPAAIARGGSSVDLLSSFWKDAYISIHNDEPPLYVNCLRADAEGGARIAEEIADFVADVHELPDSWGRTSVLEQLAATRAVLVIEFPPEGGSDHEQAAAGSLQALFVERAAGMAQRDGIGFLDEDDDVVLGIA